MKQPRELGSLVLAAALLLICVSYMTQCSSATHRNETVAVATPSHAPTAQAPHADRERKAKSVQELAAEEEKEEREKLKSVSRALQTLGADPEVRRTYGLPE